MVQCSPVARGALYHSDVRMGGICYLDDAGLFPVKPERPAVLEGPVQAALGVEEVLSSPLPLRLD